MTRVYIPNKHMLCHGCSWLHKFRPNAGNQVSRQSSLSSTEKKSMPDCDAQSCVCVGLTCALRARFLSCMHRQGRPVPSQQWKRRGEGALTRTCCALIDFMQPWSCSAVVLRMAAGWWESTKPAERLLSPLEHHVVGPNVTWPNVMGVITEDLSKWSFETGPETHI
jgi:hypothetical protein